MVLYYTPKSGTEIRFECNHIYYFENKLIVYKYALNGGMVIEKLELNIPDLKGFEVRQI